MNRLKIEQFDELLAEQSDGSPDSIDRILDLDVQLEDGYCLFSLFQEWRGAFSFTPGRPEALDPIRRLSAIVVSSQDDDTLKLYATNDWKTLVSLRGPFECAIRNTCHDCGTQYVGFGQSGFDDRHPAICSSCGNVWLQSGTDKSPPPKCICGGTYKTGKCPTCGSNAVSEKDYFSPYEYFADHTWAEKQA